jgi:hypothetical protein
LNPSKPLLGVRLTRYFPVFTGFLGYVSGVELGLFLLECCQNVVTEMADFRPVNVLAAPPD